MISTIGNSTTVGDWLGLLEKSDKDAFAYYAKNATSDIESYLFARFLKPSYKGSIADLTAWTQEKYPKEDLRKIRELSNTFQDQPTILALLEDAGLVVWSTLEREEKS